MTPPKASMPRRRHLLFGTCACIILYSHEDLADVTKLGSIRILQVDPRFLEKGEEGQ
jgi:hypothetical protein